MNQRGDPRAYVVALSHPFQPEAQGAQIPDLFSFPTQTNVTRQVFTVSTDGSGNCDFVIQPNILSTIAAKNILTNGTTGTVTSQISGGNAWFQSEVQNGFSEFGLVDPAQLAQIYARYRLVAMGVRIKSLIPPLNQQGRIICAKVPSLSHMAVYSSGLETGIQPNMAGVYPAQTPNATWEDYLGYYELPGIDGSGFISNSMLSLPSAHENSVSGMSLDNGLEIVPTVCSSDFSKWRDGVCSSALDNNEPGTNTTQYQWGQNVGGVAPDGSILTLQLDEDFLMQGGWSVLAFRASGLAPNPSGSPPVAVFDVEIVMHLEGLPPVGNTALVTSARMPPVHPGLMNAAIAAAHSIPHFRKIIHDGRHRVEHALQKARHFFSGVDHWLSNPAHDMAIAAVMGGF